jgi:hypothetical protein
MKTESRRPETGLSMMRSSFINVVSFTKISVYHWLRNYSISSMLFTSEFQRIFFIGNVELLKPRSP